MADTQDKKLFWVSTFPGIGIEEIYIPAEPEWLFETQHHHQHKSLTLTSQTNSDVPALVQLIQHDFQLTESEYPIVRNAVVEKHESQLNTSLAIQTLNDNHLSSQSYIAVTENGSDSMLHQLDIFLSNGRVWTFSSTVTAEYSNQFQITRDKIFKSIQLSPSNTLDRG